MKDIRKTHKEIEREIQELIPGALFRHIDTGYNPPRINYMRKLKRNPSDKYIHILNRKCIPIAMYGFTQGRTDRFNKKSPAHWCVDGRYKVTEGWEPPSTNIIKRKYKLKPSIYQGSMI